MMQWISAAVAAALIFHVEAVCYDKINEKYHNTGSVFHRTQPMRGSTLNGTYRCTCEPRGLLRCRAVDIPCLDEVTREFVPVGEKLQVTRFGGVRICTCQGGMGRFGYCTLPDNGGGISRNGCRDIDSGQLVAVGSMYVTERYGSKVRCRCATGGVAARGSCRNIGCRDTTRQTVAVGAKYRVSSFGYNYECTCGQQGRPQPGSCRRVNARRPVNPCDSATCHHLAQCRARGSTYNCICPSGYEGDGQTTCADVNECVRENRCDENAACTNTLGSYTCTCNEGYTGDGFECTEQILDHCRDNVVFCSMNARCLSNSTSYWCVCFAGFVGDGTTCEDENECDTGNHDCNENATCRNNEGAFMCFCNAGYSGDGRECEKMCRDENTGTYVRANHVYIKVENGRNIPCTCGEDGQEKEGSCIRPLEEAHTTTTTTTTVAPTTSTIDRSNKITDTGPKCRIGGQTYAIGETYIYGRVRQYNCECVRNKRGVAISRCSRIKSSG